MHPLVLPPHGRHVVPPFEKQVTVGVVSVRHAGATPPGQQQQQQEGGEPGGGGSSDKK
jgi:hypothetical protein